MNSDIINHAQLAILFSLLAMKCNRNRSSSEEQNLPVLQGGYGDCLLRVSRILKLERHQMDTHFSLSHTEDISRRG